MFEFRFELNMNLDNYPCHDIFNRYGRIERKKLRMT